MRKLWGALTNMTDVLKKRGNLDTGQTSTMESPVKRRREDSHVERRRDWRECWRWPANHQKLEPRNGFPLRASRRKQG